MSFDAIGIVSEDCDKALRFYALLGIEFVRAPGTEHFEAKLPNGMRFLMDSVAVIKTFEPEFVKARGNGVSLCFKQDSRAKVDEVYAAIVKAGFTGKKEPWDAFWGQRYACVIDPDGNQIDLFA